MSVEDQKRAAGEAAAAIVQPGMVVGLGTGSTAEWFVRALAVRKLDIVGVATSRSTAALAQELGIRIAELGETGPIDLTVDGADEIGPALSLIKGGGAALLREKLVWVKDGSPVLTDGGNVIYDIACGRIDAPAALAAALKSVTGVVDHGLFLDLADLALVATDAGVQEIEP